VISDSGETAKYMPSFPALKQESDATTDRLSATTVNCHSDYLCYAIGSYRRNKDLSLVRQWREKLAVGDVDAVFCAVGGDGDGFPTGYSETLMYFRMVDELCKQLQDDFRLVRSAEEIAEARHDGNVGLFLGLEGCHALEGRLDSIEGLYRHGLRWLALTWNLSNELGDGTGTEEHGGLTPFGRDVIRMANRLGIVIDLVHTSRPTYQEAAAVCRGPFIVSHSNSAKLCAHPRNLTDEQIRMVASAGGVVGINFFPGLLASGEAKWADIERHICSVADLVGTRHVALGPDFIDFAPREMAQILHESPVDYGRVSLYPSGFSDDSCFRDIAVQLRAAGFDHEEIADIMGRNVWRVIKEVGRLSARG